MMKYIRIWMAAMIFAGVVGGSFVTATVSPSVSAAACEDRVFGFPTWYRGVYKNTGDACEIQSPADVTGGLNSFIWKIVLNVIEFALVLVGYISVGFIIYGGYLYMIGAGAPDKIVSGRKTILNAVVGLVISFFSVAIVNIVVGRFS